MRGTVVRRAVLAILALALVAARAADDVVVTIERPTPFSPTSGEVEVEAVIGGTAHIVRVDFLVDGVHWGGVNAPPYRLVVDVGQENAEHLFQAVAYTDSGATAVAEVRTPRFRVDDEVAVTLQQLYATVTCGGERVADLGPDEFRLEEEGRPQRIVTFGAGEVPYTAIVLLDASESMRGAKLDNAKRGVLAFLEGMRPLDEGKLIVFSDHPRVVTPFSSLPELLTAALGRLRATGGSAVNDYLYLALRQLEPRQGRRLVILLSDGEDAHSVLDTSVLLDTVRRSQALIYWLRLTSQGGAAMERNTFQSIWRSPEENRFELGRLVEAVLESGGRIEPIVSPGQIESAFAGILDELSEQYALGFYPQGRLGDGRWRKVELSVQRPGCRVRSRAGFLDS